MFVFGLIVGLLLRRPRHGHFRFDAKAILFGLWMTPWLLLSGSIRSAWPFFIALAVWIVGACTSRIWRNWLETR